MEKYATEYVYLFYLYGIVLRTYLNFSWFIVIILLLYKTFNTPLTHADVRGTNVKNVGILETLPPPLPQVKLL